MDASLHKNMRTLSGADAIENQIHDLNQKYSSLLQSVLDYLEELKGKFTAAQNQKVYLLILFYQSSKKDKINKSIFFFLSYVPNYL